MEGAIALALAAGLVAAVNPCGFALLPAYLSFLVLGEAGADNGSRLTAVARALALTAAMTLGFVAVFGGFGLLAAPTADAVARNLPWVSLAIGLLLVGLGGWLLVGRELPVLTPKLAQGPAVNRRFASMVLFGISYAIASLGCTVGPFLAVVFLAADTVTSRLGLFLAYAVGMGLVVGLVALAVALAKVSLVRRLRRIAPAVNRASGVLLVVAGAYVAWYGWYEIRVFRGGDVADPIIDTAADVQARLADWLDQLGVSAIAVIFAAMLALTVSVAILLGLRRAAGRETPGVNDVARRSGP
jgi:cytochrome c-type biogenesis protein